MKTLAFSCAVALSVLLLASPGAARPWKFVMLHNFCTKDNCADGSFPTAGLTRDGHGNLYGTTETGGAHNQGVVFELERHRKAYTFEVLHDFCFTCGDGVFPYAGLIVDVSGNLYGTTLGGGAHDCGIVFKLAPGRKKLKVLHDFCTQDNDGDTPDQALGYAGKSAGALYDGVSPLYGTTPSGGAHGRGTAFALMPGGGTWTLTTLYAFCALVDCADGGNPSGELLVDDLGNLFGNASFGGGAGLVYELSPAGAGAQVTEKVLHAFCAPEDCADGQSPVGALAMTPQGDILGTTENALGSEGGAIFKLTPNGGGWQESLPHVFCTGTCKDGYLPSGGLMADSNRIAYGVTELGGTGENGIGGGAAFEFKGDRLVPIYEFCSLANCADGRVPMGTLTMDPSGAVFGVTTQGGPNSAAGVAFELIP